MLSSGGALNGERIIDSRTLDYMTSNHLPQNRDHAAMGHPQFAETTIFVSPEEDMAVMFLTQLIPSGGHPIRRQIRAAAYGAITD